MEYVKVINSSQCEGRGRLEESGMKEGREVKIEKMPEMGKIRKNEGVENMGRGTNGRG